MSSKRLFSWSKRQSNVEPYYKTGGLLPIDTLGDEPSNDHEAKDTQKARRRPSNLTIIPPNHQQFASSPLSSPCNVARVSSTSNLMAIFNDMLRSPASSAGACPRSASVLKPLPTRSRSSSVPSTPDLPVELPGSLLQHNQGFPYLDTPNFAPSRPTSQNIRRGTHPPGNCPEDEGDVFDLLHLFPEPLNHSKSVPSLHAGYRDGAMKSSRAGPAANASANKSKTPRVHHRKALSDIEWQTIADSTPTNDNNAAVSSNAALHDNGSRDSKRLRMDSSKLQQPSPMIFKATPSDNSFERRASCRDDLGAAHTPTLTTSRHEPTEDLNTTIASQNQTISTLQSQFGSLRLSHEAHVSSLAEAHAAEVASLRNYARLLEEQLAQRPSLHHDVTTSADAHLASSNNILILLDTPEPSSTPSCQSSQHTAGTSASSTLSFCSASEKQQQSPRRSPNSSEMESLKRKLSTTRRPQTADRNLLPELNQYKQNNAALQTQISSLMAKLNESKKSEKTLRATLQEVEQRFTEAESKTSKAQQLASSAEALQNTIDHLESRLEIANTEKLDAQEELFNMRALKSPFDAQFPELQTQGQDAHESMDTVFSIDSLPGRRRGSTSTASKFVAHIEQLEDEIRQKDAYIVDLEGDNNLLRQMLDKVNHQCDEINLQLDIQNELLGKTKETDAQIKQLRTAVLERETVIGEKEKSVRAVERQLEHHKLLLQAEIRKHATTSRHFTDENDPLPELTALATKKDIDRWIQKLNQRLQKAKPMSPVKASTTAAEALVEDLRNEIDFYVREIIYYKLDIRGYKSDIKKLNKITAQLGSYGNRASDLESDTSSLQPAPTPSRARFLATTPELRSSAHPSPALIGPVIANMGSSRALTPPSSTTADSPNNSPLQELGTDDYEEAASRVSILPRTPTKVTIISAPHTTHTDQDPQCEVYTCPDVSRQPSSSNHDDHSEMLALAMGNPDLAPPPNDTSATMPGDDRPGIEREVSETSTVRPVVPTSRFSQDLFSESPSRKPFQTSHSRVGSESSNLSYNLQLHSSSSRTERKLSASPSTGIPFVIAMGSPHNPAIAVAAKNKPVTRPHKPSLATSKPGLDGTMASSTPLSSPTSIGSASPAPTAASPAPTGHKRKLSLSFRKQENESPTTPTHTRSLSGGSIRTAIRWTRGNAREREKDMQSRKDSIGMPQPLGSPFRSESGLEMMGGETRAIDFAPSREDGQA